MQQIQVLPAEIKLKTLEDAIKTIRKTGMYGYRTFVGGFEWPTTKDLLEMVKNIPTKIQVLKHKKSTSNGRYFGAFQVILSNGISSPVFTASGTND